jgi:Glycosyl transferase family 2
MEPVASVVIYSDYGLGGRTDWREMKEVLAAVARQDFTEPVELILVESADRRESIPADLTAILPSLKVVVSPAVHSAALKNDGVRAATAPIVGMLPADCLPAPDWIRRFVELFRDRPDVDAVSGRTDYPGDSLVVRTLALLERGFVDPGRAGATWSVSYNNAAYRRALLVKHPFPDLDFACGGKGHAEAIRRGGGRLYFEPRMKVVHHFEGWDFEKDVRRNLGYAAIESRRREPRIAFAWVARLGYAAIPFMAVARTVYDWRVCLRSGRLYGLRWHEIPFALGLSAAVRLFEIPGMIAAVRGRGMVATAFR